MALGQLQAIQECQLMLGKCLGSQEPWGGQGAQLTQHSQGRHPVTGKATPLPWREKREGRKEKESKPQRHQHSLVMAGSKAGVPRMVCTQLYRPGAVGGWAHLCRHIPSHRKKGTMHQTPSLAPNQAGA